MENDVIKRVVALIVVLTIGVAISYAGSDGGATFGRIPVFMICGALAFFVNWVAFIPANMAQTEKYYDLVGSVTYLSIIGTSVFLSPDLSLRGTVAALMVVVWALRLGTFLFKRISQDGHDDRFDDIKVNPFRFFIAWTIQALWALLTAACAIAIITSSEQKPMELMAYIGFLIWVIGFSIEIIADAQKRAFKRNPENKGKFIDTGLWAWSRHPNYFGEITLWVGMAILAMPILNGLQWFTLISPLFVIVLLTKVSGIPMLAKKGQQRWGDEPAYQAYLDNTSVLIPMPPNK